ncbi:glycosyltransferase family 2 protein [Candidatus Woesebacteria bacterium]|nr:glycosyltransferase family 2 protein [Candidatus Woesebacteria bacterium]
MKLQKKQASCIFYVIAFGKSDLVSRCLDSLSRVVSKSNIVLIDNASVESLSVVAKKYQIRLIRLKQNKGYAGGCNAAVEDFLHSSADYICVMNSDVFVTKGFVSELQTCFDSVDNDASIAIFQPELYFDAEYQRVENTGILYYKSGLAFQANHQSAYQCVNGACMFLRRSAIEYLKRIDGFVFEELYWSYAEDVELSLRLQSRGWKTVVFSSLQAVHLQSASFGKRSARSLWYYARNLLWTLLLTRTTSELIISLPLILLGQIRIIFEFILHGRPDYYFSLLYETYRNRDTLRLKRRHWKTNQMIELAHTYQFGAFPLWRLQ